MRATTIAIAFILILAATTICLTGCGRGGSYPKASLRSDVVRPYAPRGNAPAPYRIAVASMSSPGRTLEIYGPMIRYLSKRLDRPAQLTLAHSYAELNRIVASEEAIAAFVCSGGYVDGHREFGLELVAAPRFHGHASYFGYIIVPADSKASGLRELRGKRFAFTDRDSHTGCAVPTHQIMKLGERPESFFGSLVYTRSHDRALSAVIDGIVDGAATYSMAYELAACRDPEVAKRTKVIARYGPYGSPPIVVNPNAPEHFKASLKRVLLSMHTDVEGRKILDSMLIDRFVEVEDSAYENIRAMRREMRAWTNDSRPLTR